MTDLTERELEIARLVSTGLPNRAIAEELGISERTVKNHLCFITAKWKTRNRTQIAVRFLRELELIEPPGELTIFKFNYYPVRGYVCNRPGDNSGYYVSLNDYERLRKRYEQ